jgi:hypothetical protein
VVEYEEYSYSATCDSIKPLNYNIVSLALGGRFISRGVGTLRHTVIGAGLNCEDTFTGVLTFKKIDPLCNGDELFVLDLVS